jgi:hypothetical protein
MRANPLQRVALKRFIPAIREASLFLESPPRW